MDSDEAVVAIEAILTLLPIDDFIDAPMLRMGPVDNPAEITPIQDEARALVERIEGRTIEVEMLERGAFYQRARQAAAIVATGERTAIALFGFVKGIVRSV